MSVLYQIIASVGFWINEKSTEISNISVFCQQKYRLFLPLIRHKDLVKRQPNLDVSITFNRSYEI